MKEQESIEVEMPGGRFTIEGLGDDFDSEPTLSWIVQL